jgi:tetratricopeptide (TPR) repeat protein
VRPQLSALAVLVAFSLGAGYLLIPSPRELALIALRDNDYETARAQYEELLGKGDAPVDVYVGLVELYVELGAVDEAIAVLERYVAKHPASVTVRDRLDGFYEDAQRPEDRLVNLRALVRLDPTEERLRSLLELLEFGGKLEEQAAVTAALVERYGARPGDLLRLAELQSDLGMMREAVATIERVWRQDPRTVPPRFAELWVAILADLGEEAAAIEAARRLLEANPEDALAEQIAAALAARGKADIALRAFERYVPQLDRMPVLAHVVVRLMQETRRYDDSAALLARLRASGTLTVPLRIAYIDTALTLNRNRLVLELARGVDAHDLPDSVLYDVVNAAIDEGDLDAVRAIRDRLGEERLSHQPVLAAEIAVALDQREEAARWLRLVEEEELEIDDRIALARVLARLDRVQEAVTLLTRLAADPETPADEIAGLAHIFLQIGQAKAGLPLFERLRAARPGEGVEEGWARLASAVGKPADVIAWLGARGDDRIGLTLLADLYYIANDAEKFDLALAAGERLHRRRGSDEDRRNYAAALVATGQAGKAVALLKPDLLSGDAETRADAVYTMIEAKAWSDVLPTLTQLADNDPAAWLWAFVEAAIAARRPGDAVPLLVAKAGRANRAREVREQALHALVEIGDQRTLLPALRDAARELGDPWPDSYQDALERFGRNDELVAFLRDRAQQKGLPLEKRREYAYDVLARADRETATAVFAALAETDAPDGEDTGELLALWGPEPPAAAFDWLAGRAAGANDDTERAAWLGHLIDLGAAERALEIARAAETRPRSDALVRVEVDALALLERHDELAMLIERVARATTDPDRLAEYGRMAMDAEHVETARTAYERLLVVSPNHPVGLRQMGIVEHLSADYRKSAELLRRYLQHPSRNTKDDWEAYYYYGLDLGEIGPREESRQTLETALKVMAGVNGDSGDIDYSKVHAQADVLNRIGRRSEAMALYEGLLRDKPRDVALRADYVDWLLVWGERARAAAILSEGPPQVRQDGPGSPGAGRLRRGDRAAGGARPATGERAN